MVPKHIYIVAFLITVAIFGTAIYITSVVGNARIQELSGIEDRISTDILSIETQFELLSKIPCEDIDRSTFLANELGEYGDRLTQTESRLGATNPEVIQLKKQYSLLQIKDYLLTERIAESCKDKAVSVLYFYGEECKDCEKAGFALSQIRESYPSVRVYSFDLNLQLGALNTLANLYDISTEELPVFVINRKKTVGFESLEKLTALLPKSVLATTTKVTTQ